jgi:hypothetical protein
VKSGLRRRFAPGPFFNEMLHGVKLRIFPRLEALRVMQDKPVVTAMTKFSLDIGTSRENVRDFLPEGSIRVSTKGIWDDMNAYCFFDTEDFVDQRRLPTSRLMKIGC